MGKYVLLPVAVLKTAQWLYVLDAIVDHEDLERGVATKRACST